jgi:hypothetical protein
MSEQEETSDPRVATGIAKITSPNNDKRYYTQGH